MLSDGVSDWTGSAFDSLKDGVVFFSEFSESELSDIVGVGVFFGG